MATADRFDRFTDRARKVLTLAQDEAQRFNHEYIGPEHILLDQNGIPVEVVVVEPTGSETQVVVRLHGEELICVFRERITAKPGETIKISPTTNLVHLFDAETGKRID